MSDNPVHNAFDVARGSDTSKNSGKAPKKEHSTRKGKGRASKADAPLPEGHQNLLELFTVVDHAYCFLTRNSIPARVANLQSMVWRLFPGRFGADASFLPRLRRLADIAPTVVALGVPPEDGVDDDLKEFQGTNKTEAQRLEIRFLQKSTAGTGKAAVSRRQQLVRRALLEHASGRPNGADTSPAAAASAIQGRRERRRKSHTLQDSNGRTESDVDGQMVDEEERRDCPSVAEPRITSEIEEAGGSCGGRRGCGHKSGAPRKAAARTRAARLREQKGQSSTGKALSASDPLSMSPAYVLGGRDAGRGAADAARADDIFLQGGVSDPDVTHGEMDLPPSGEGGEINDEEGRAARRKEDADAKVSQRLRFDPHRALEYLKSLPIFEGQAVHTETLPGRVGEFADTVRPLHPEVAAALTASKGVTRLFKHQALAIDAARAGQHVSLSTATSSGKSVVFNVSVLEAIMGDRPDAVAFYLFPTKALAQDQLRSLKELVGASSYLSERVRPMTLDGDTPFSERGVVVEEANIILTNPDMLHASVLPGHKRFQRILGNLSHVVIDEAHVYRGAFGAHVSMVLRRLLRLWAVNASPGPPPQFICCSATMSEARVHFASLLPLEECLGGRRMLYSANVDTAPAGKKTFVLWRPPVVEDWMMPTSKPRGEGTSKGSRFRGRRRRQHGLKRASSSSKHSPVGLPEQVKSPQDGEGGVPVADKSKVGRAKTVIGSGVASLGLSLRGNDGWRTVPTDNFYNREYVKLMGAALPRRGVDPPAALTDSATEGTGKGACVEPIRNVAGDSSDPKKDSSTSTSCCSDGGGGGALITLEEVVQSSGGVSGRGRGLDFGERRRRGVASSAAVSESGSSEEAVEAAALAGVGTSHAATAVAADDEISAEAASEGLDGGGGAVALGLAGQEAAVEWEDGRRRSPICETAQILAALVKQRVRTLAFCRTRKLTELTLRYGRQDLERTAPHLVSLVQGYRGGYTKDERRKIESCLFSNKLLGCTATCALELGVDIGELDVTLHLGFPGSVSSLRQQAGRAGRGGKDSLAIMVLFQDPISQYFVRNPAEVLHKEPEAAVLDSKNELVLRAHLLCAAAECPLGVPALGDVTDAALFGGEERLQAVIDTLIYGDFPRLVRVAGNLGWKANPGLDPPPCRRVGLRMIDPVSFSVVDNSRGGDQYDTVEYSRAFFTLFEGAIYLYQAQQYLVTKLDLSTHLAHTTPVKVNYYTAGTNNVDVKVTKRLEVSDDNFAHTGCVDVVCTVYGFVKKQVGTGITLEKGECRLPPLQYATRAFWLDVGVTAKRAVDDARRDFEGGVHAVGHALLSVVPLFLLCDPEDVDCEHVRPHFLQRPQPRRILVYDKRPGGVGVADAMFGCHRAVLSKALELVEGCPCPDGCVACIHDHGCTGYNSVIDKQAALIVLKRLIQDMMEAGQKASSASTTPVPADEEGGGEIQAQQRLGCTRRRSDSQSCDELPKTRIDGGGFFLDASSGAGDGGNGAAADSGARAMTARGNDGTEEVDGGGAGVAIPSPRKKQRLRNLHFAKTMERAREQDMAVLGCWIPSVP